MKTLLRTLFVGSVLAVGAVAAVAATAADPVVGTWNLNLAKSTFSPGPAPKSATRTYAQTAKGIELTFTQVGADGKSASGASTYHYDGKDVPISGSPDYDTLSVKRGADGVVHSTQKMAGKTVGTTTRTVSKDGKTLTLAAKGTSANGKPYTNKMVFDKQ